MATRAEQRSRTRRAILDAANALLDDGARELTVDEIAATAGVSRATFYRYFSAPADVLWHVYVDRRLPPPEDVVGDGDDVHERMARAERAVNGYLLAMPDATRAFERAMLERSIAGQAQPEDRPARRLQFIDVALAPIADQLDSEDRFLVRHALALTLGSSVVPALLDTCGLDEDQARRVTAFAAQAIVAEALRRAAPRDGRTPAASASAEHVPR